MSTESDTAVTNDVSFRIQSKFAEWDSAKRSTFTASVVARTAVNATAVSVVGEEKKGETEEQVILKLQMPRDAALQCVTEWLSGELATATGFTILDVTRV